MPDVQTQTDPPPVGLESSDGFLRMNAFRPAQPPVPYDSSHWVDDGEPTFHPHLQSNYPMFPPGEPLSPSEHTFGVEPYYFMDMPPPMLAGEPNAPPPSFPIVSPMHATPDHHPSLNSEKIKELEDGEDSIRQARRQVLGARFSLKHHRKELRDLRQKTSMEEGSITTMIGNLLRDPDVKLAEEIRNAHARLLQLRDQLGSVEAEYEKAEERYEDMEWKYTQKESSFVTKLIDDANNPQEENLTMTNVGSYVYVSGPAETRPQQLDYQDFQEAPVYFESQRSLDMSGDFSLTTELGSAITPMPGEELPRLVTKHETPDLDTAAPQIPRSYSEPALSKAHQMWTDTKKRIESWLLDSLICSAHQRFILKNMLSIDGLDDGAWWGLVKQTWISDSPSTPPLGMHGACTASSDEFVDAIITTDECIGSENANTERPEVETVRIAPALGTLNEASTPPVSPPTDVSHLDSIPGPQQDFNDVAPASNCSIPIPEPKGVPERDPEKEPEKEPKKVQHMGLQGSKASLLRKENLGHSQNVNISTRSSRSEPPSFSRRSNKRLARASSTGNAENATPNDAQRRFDSPQRKQTVQGLSPIIASDDNYSLSSDLLGAYSIHD